MKTQLSAIFVFALSLAASSSQPVAQAYPTAPVKVVSDSSPGSAPDVILRIVGDLLGQAWGQQIVVINQPGAGSSRAVRAAATATPDGYTLLMAVSSAFVTVKGTAPGIPIELPNDFMAVSLVGEQPMFMAVSPQTGVKSLAGLIELARAKPGELSYAASGRGRLSHLTGELLQRRTGIKLLMVPYSAGGPAQAISDLAGGRVNLIIEGGTALIGAMQPGLITGIAVAAETRLAEFPDLAAASEAVPGFRAAGWVAMMAPNGTPESIVRKISADLGGILTRADVRSRLAAVGSYTRPLSPEDTISYIQADQRTWAPILEDLAKAPQP